MWSVNRLTAGKESALYLLPPEVVEVALLHLIVSVNGAVVLCSGRHGQIRQNVRAEARLAFRPASCARRLHLVDWLPLTCQSAFRYFIRDGAESVPVA